MACMCPVDPICHQLTCHRRLFSLSRMRNRHFIVLLMPIDFAMSATPTSQRTLFTYLWYAWRQSWRCAKYSNSVCVGLCGCDSRISLHVWDDHEVEVRYSLSMTAAVSSPCATLSSASILKKNCWVELLGLGLGLGLELRLRLQLGLGSVLVYMVTVSR